MSSRSRLARIEARRNPPRPTRTPAQRRAFWEARARLRQTELTPKDVAHTRDKIGLFKLQGTLAGQSAEELVERIASYPDRPGTLAGEAAADSRSLGLIEYELWRAVHQGQESLSHLLDEMPPEWRDALEAGDLWREKLLALPPDRLAGWIRAHRALLKRGASEDEMLTTIEQHVGPFGITNELLERVCGREIESFQSDEEAEQWLIYAPIADVLSSDWAWDTREKVRALDAGNANNNRESS